MTSNNNTIINGLDATIINGLDATIINGLVAGTIGAFTVYPIDVIKTRMQNQNLKIEKLYNSGFDCARQLWNQGRYKLFYKGCLPQIIGIGLLY